MTYDSIRIAPPTGGQIEAFASMIPDLIHATGPVSYDYQFGADRRLFDLVVEASWRAPNTLYAAATSTLALSEGNLVGIEVGFHGPDFYTFKNNLVSLVSDLLASGKVDQAPLEGLVARAEKASYLNAHIPDDVYYVLAICVPERHRGKRIGAKLLAHAIERAREGASRELHLDVLSDNPAVQFYHGMGLTTVAEITSPELARDHGFPSELRMTIPL